MLDRHKFFKAISFISHIYYRLSKAIFVFE